VVLIKYEKCRGIPNCEILLTDGILLQLDILDLPIFYSSHSRLFLNLHDCMLMIFYVHLHP